MKILITGGAGFIGSALIRHILSDTEHHVVNIDKLTYAGNLESLPDAQSSEKYKFFQQDICNQSSMLKILQEEKPDWVMHLAAESHVDRSIDGPKDFIQTNIVGTYSLLEACRFYFTSLNDSEKSTFRFHHISTDEVFGDLPHPDDCDGDLTSLPKFTEDSSYHPSSPYSASKASSDLLVKSWHKTFGLPVVLSNCSNNYGPFHFPEKLIPLTIINALKGNEISVYGDGSQIRDWLYVEDHAKALLTVVKKGRIGETYNVGGNCERRNIDVVKIICQMLDEAIPKNENYEKQINFVSDRPGHDRRYAIDNTKIQLELNWKPEESFESGIKKTVEWYLNNESWWKNVLSGSYRLNRIGLGEEI